MCDLGGSPDKALCGLLNPITFVGGELVGTPSVLAGLRAALFGAEMPETSNATKAARDSLARAPGAASANDRSAKCGLIPTYARSIHLAVCYAGLRLPSPCRTTSSNEASKGIVNAHFNLQENHRVFCSSCRNCFSRKFSRAREGWWRRRWGRRPFRRRRDVHGRRIWRGWFSRRRIWWGRFSPRRENVRRRIQPSPLLRRLQCLCGELIQSVAL